MPHDRDGVALSVGMTVYIPCEITDLHLGDEHCNCSLRTLEPMYPEKTGTNLSLNTRQVVHGSHMPGSAAAKDSKAAKDTKHG